MTLRSDGAALAEDTSAAERGDAASYATSSTRPASNGAACADLPPLVDWLAVDPLAGALCEAALRLVPLARSAALYLPDARLASMLPHGAPLNWLALPLDDPLTVRLQQARTPLVLTDDAETQQLIHQCPPVALLAIALPGDTLPGFLALDLTEAADAETATALRGLVAGAGAALLTTLRGTPARGLDHAEMVDWLAQGFALLDDARQVHYVNPALTALLDLPPWRKGGCVALDDAACPASLRTLLDPSRGAIEGPYTVVLNGADRRSRTLQVLPSTLRPAGWQARLVLDVTAERSSAEERSQFISQITHELRTPLQHIMGFASILADISELPVETTHRFLGHITEESRRLARLVDDLAELARIENGRFAVNKKSVQLDLLLRDIAARLTPGAEAKQLKLRFESAVPDVWLETDQMRLEQVLTNLVENAIKFVAPGGQIALLLEATPGDVFIRVRDDGPGIPPGSLRRVFDRYYKVPRGDGQPTRGMGLGLYISREIVHALGGEIWVESELGEGSTFTIRFPRR